MKLHARAYRPRHKPGEMNKTEMEYGQHLQKLKFIHEIADYAFEVETLKLGPNCRFTPDFRVLREIRTPREDGSMEITGTYIEFHEVKGTRKGKMFAEDDALVKIKAASEIHHMYKFILVWKGTTGQWEKKEIN